MADVRWRLLEIAGECVHSADRMTKARLHYYTRQPRYILRTVLLVLGMGLLASWLEDKIHGRDVSRVGTAVEEVSDEDGDENEDGSDEIEAETEDSLLRDIRYLAGPHHRGKLLDLIESIPNLKLNLDLVGGEPEELSKSKLRGEVMAVLEKSKFAADRKSLFQDYADALLLEGKPRVEAQERLRVQATALPPVKLANEMMGDLFTMQRESLQAVNAYVIEGKRGDASGAREMALDVCINNKLADRLVELRSQPEYEAELQQMGLHRRSAAAILSGNYGELMKTTAAGAWESAVHQPVEVILTFLCGVVWFIVIHQLGGVKLKRNWISLLAVAMGVLSPVLTLFIYGLQRHYHGLEENGTFWNDLLFFIAGVGLREEVSKLILFAPLLWLLRNKSEAEILVTAACVGLGFAIEENINYFRGVVAAMPLARFVSANFLHVATTAIAGLALARWVRFPKSYWEQGLIAIMGVILVHGFYDFCIVSPVPRVELSFQGFPFLILLGLAQFFLTDLRRVRDPRGNVIGPLFAFLVGIAIISSFAMLAGTMQFGFEVALVSLIGSGLSSAILIVMFSYHLKDL